MMTAHLLQLELMSYSSLLQFYGAGYEIASLIDGGLAKIGDITYLFWHVDVSGNSIQLSYPYHVCRYAYRNGCLRFEVRDYGLITATESSHRMKEFTLSSRPLEQSLMRI